VLVGGQLERRACDMTLAVVRVALRHAAREQAGRFTIGELACVIIGLLTWCHGPSQMGLGCEDEDGGAASDEEGDDDDDDDDDLDDVSYDPGLQRAVPGSPHVGLKERGVLLEGGAVELLAEFDDVGFPARADISVEVRQAG
jgi:hypothetical protein